MGFLPTNHHMTHKHLGKMYKLEMKTKHQNKTQSHKKRKMQQQSTTFSGHHHRQKKKKKKKNPFLLHCRPAKPNR
jgi:hypothetical protein